MDGSSRALDFLEGIASQVDLGYKTNILRLSWKARDRTIGRRNAILAGRSSLYYGLEALVGERMVQPSYSEEEADIYKDCGGKNNVASALSAIAAYILRDKDMHPSTWNNTTVWIFCRSAS